MESKEAKDKAEQEKENLGCPVELESDLLNRVYTGDDTGDL